MPPFCMKTLYLIRHAKSSWANPGQADQDRPLNERGLKDAPRMAERLRKEGCQPDLILSSPARRAFKTARFFAREFEIPGKEIQVIEDLYLASAATIARVIDSVPAKISQLALVGHNPGITEYANGLTSIRLDNMPTCSVFAVTADLSDWSDFEKARKSFQFFHFPRQVT